MTNPFHIDALDPIGVASSEILKGDFNGHPFRGNQYSTGFQGGTQYTGGVLPMDKESDLSRIKGDSHDLAAQAHHSEAREADHFDRREITSKQAALDHMAIAKGHKEVGDFLAKSVQDRTSAGLPVDQKMLTAMAAHYSASQLHEAAAKAAEKAAKDTGPDDWNSDQHWSNQFAHGDAQRKATEATEKALQATSAITEL